MKTIYEVGQKGKLNFMLNLRPEREEDNLPRWAWWIIAVAYVAILAVLAKVRLVC